MENWGAKLNSALFANQREDGILSALNEQLEYASSHCAFYEHLKRFLPLASLGDIGKLPFTAAEDVRLRGREMLCLPAAKIRRIVSLFTSGTTASPKRLFFSRGDIERTVEFFREGMGWMCSPGDTVAVLFPCSAPDGIGDLLSRGLERLGCKPLRIGLADYPENIRELLLREKPAVLVGLPWQVRLLAICVPELRPERVLLSADYVPEAMYATLERLWGCRVLSHFGMTETLYGGAVESLLHRGMYLRRDELYAEIIDPKSGAPLPFGEVGELSLTTLRREAMPLVRLRTGDLAKMSSPGIIERVYGRMDAHPGNYALQEALCPIENIFDYALERDKKGVLLLSALVAENAPPELEGEILEHISHSFGVDVENISVTLLPCPRNAVRVMNKGKRVNITLSADN